MKKIDNTEQLNNENLWRDIKNIYKNYIKPTRKTMGLQYKRPMYPYLFMGRWMDDE